VIAATIAIVVALAPGMTRVGYGNVPADVTSVALYAWVAGSAPSRMAAEVERAGSDLAVRAESGRRVVVRLERADGTYLIDGPFWWPSADAARVMDRRWRRTIVATSADAMSGDPAFEWLTAAAEGRGEWPHCFASTDRAWSCWGVPHGEDGVLACRLGDRLWWTVAGQGGPPVFRSSRWGRLLVVRTVDGRAPTVRFARPMPPRSQRVAGVRLETAVVAAAQSTAMIGGAAWLSGEEIPAGAWAEISTATAGPAYFPLQDIADGSLSIPVIVTLDDSRAVDGVVAGARNERASGALVTVFRLIDARQAGPPREREVPRRVFAAETTADREGVFHIDRLGDADYEITAWHPQLGRSSVAAPRHPGVLTIRLQAAGVVRGRVVMGGKPASGIDVISVPAQDAFRTAEDPLDLKGGDARTGADGRFSGMPSAAGGGELRVGGGPAPVRRIPLPRAPAPLLDLGDIDLGSPIEFTVVLDQDPGCDVRVAGPVGQSGLQIVMGARSGPGLHRVVVPEPGLWVFQLLCGRETRPLVPSTLQITAGNTGKEVRFSVR